MARDLRDATTKLEKCHGEWLRMLVCPPPRGLAVGVVDPGSKPRSGSGLSFLSGSIFHMHSTHQISIELLAAGRLAVSLPFISNHSNNDDNSYLSSARHLAAFASPGSDRNLREEAGCGQQAEGQRGWVLLAPFLETTMPWSQQKSHLGT